MSDPIAICPINLRQINGVPVYREWPQEREVADTKEVVHSTALMLRTAPNVCGHVAQVVACLGQACEGIRRVMVVLSEFIDSRSACTPQHDDAPSMAEPDMSSPTIETDMDVPVAEVADVDNAVEIAPSIVCYCGLPVA